MDADAVRRAQARIDAWTERERRGIPHPPWQLVENPDGTVAIVELPAVSEN